MPTLLLENVPDELFQRIERLAASDHVPVEEETLRLLQRAVNGPQTPPRTDVMKLLDHMWQNRITPKPGTPDSLTMLREDRDR
jgi:hypothetical protein